MHNNDTAIKLDLLKLGKDLIAATDKYDIHFLKLRIISLNAQLSGVKPFDGAKIGLQ